MPYVFAVVLAISVLLIGFGLRTGGSSGPGEMAMSDTFLGMILVAIGGDILLIDVIWFLYWKFL